jgi:hypothetical protein
LIVSIHCDKIPDINNLRGKGCIMACGFRAIINRAMLAGSLISGPVVQQCIMVEGHGREKLLISWQSDRGRDQKEDIPSSVCHQ